MTRHVLFDCFGTLLDTGSGSVLATEWILQNLSSSLDPKAFYAEWKKEKKQMMHTAPFRSEKVLFAESLGLLFKRYGIQADPGVEVKPMIDSLFATRPLFPDVRETLRELDRRGIDYAIASTTDTDSLLHYLKEAELSVPLVFTSENLQAYKPDPRFYQTILEQTGWQISECLFVGDSPEDDVFGPAAIGMPAILLDRKGSHQDFPHPCIGSLTGLAEYL
ncbi:MAG: HAD family hydrolase [Clostridia bacterium]|nr:HAD family hydrolase [Clostridia bacterium]